MNVIRWLATRRGAATAALVFGGFGPSCSGDHGRLAADDSAASSPAASSSTGVGGDGGAGVSASSSSTGGAGGDPRPAGPTALTVVNGVADYDAVRLCFLGYPGGENGDQAPWPSDPEGLAFARGLVVDPLADLVPAGVDVRVVVLAGDLAALAGKTCSELVAAPDPSGPVVVAPLAVLPASVFASEKSLLLVPNGCLGGPGHSGGLEKLACGTSYTESTPTPGLVVVPMSRKTDAVHVGLQVVHAAAPMPVVDVKLTPVQGGFELVLATALSAGAIGPAPPFFGLSAQAFTIGEALLKTYAPADTYPTSAVKLEDAFTAGAIEPAAFVDGHGFVLVAVGGYPGVMPSSWWHGYTYTLVVADPRGRAN